MPRHQRKPKLKKWTEDNRKPEDRSGGDFFGRDAGGSYLTSQEKRLKIQPWTMSSEKRVSQTCYRPLDSVKKIRCNRESVL